MAASLTSVALLVLHHLQVAKETWRLHCSSAFQGLEQAHDPGVLGRTPDSVIVGSTAHIQLLSAGPTFLTHFRECTYSNLAYLANADQMPLNEHLASRCPAILDFCVALRERLLHRHLLLPGRAILE